MELFLEKLIDLAIAEDIGDGDHSALASIPADAVGKAKLLFKDEGIIAGIDIALQVFKKVDSSLNTTIFYSDGDRLKFGDIAFITEGSVRSLLQERSPLPAKDPHLQLEWFALLAETAMPEGGRLALLPVSHVEGEGQSFLPLMVLPDQTRKIFGLSNFYTPLFGFVDEANVDCSVVAQVALNLRCAQPSYNEARFAPLDPASQSFLHLRKGFRDSGWLVDDYFCFGNWYEPVEPGKALEYIGKRPSKL